MNRMLSVHKSKGALNGCFRICRRYLWDTKDYLPADEMRREEKKSDHDAKLKIHQRALRHAETAVPYPVLDGPNPYVNPMFKRRVKYPSIMDLNLPLSSIEPPGGHPESWIWNKKLNKIGITRMSADLFNHPLRKDILHRVHVFERNKGRGFSHVRVKNRAEVRGSGRKVRPQKGTGMARMSDRLAPHVRGGGKAHGRRPRDFTTDLPPRVRIKALKIALSARFREGDIIIWDNFQFPHTQEEEAINLKKLWGWWNVLFVFMGNFDTNLAKATMNIDGMQPTDVRHLTVGNLLKYKKIVIDFESLAYLTEKYSLEAEVRRWNEAASINRLAEAMAPDAFPEEGKEDLVEDLITDKEYNEELLSNTWTHRPPIISNYQADWKERPQGTV